MQDIYTMIVNNGLPLVITVIFLYQTIMNIKKPDNDDEHENIKYENIKYEHYNHEVLDNNFILIVVTKLDSISEKLSEIINLLKKSWYYFIFII